MYVHAGTIEIMKESPNVAEALAEEAENEDDEDPDELISGGDDDDDDDGEVNCALLD